MLIELHSGLVRENYYVWKAHSLAKDCLGGRLGRHVYDLVKGSETDVSD